MQRLGLVLLGLLVVAEAQAQQSDPFVFCHRQSQLRCPCGSSNIAINLRTGVVFDRAELDVSAVMPPLADAAANGLFHGDVVYEGAIELRDVEAAGDFGRDTPFFVIFRPLRASTAEERAMCAALPE